MSPRGCLRENWKREREREREKKGTQGRQQGLVRGMNHEDMLGEPKWQIKTNMGKTRWEPRKSRNGAQGQREKQSLAEW
jgi:hypothetical protein